MAEQRDFDIGDPDSFGARYRDRYDRSLALVVGIDTYKHPRLRPLGKAEEDARDMAEVLAGEPYRFQVDLLLGKKATRLAITRALSGLIRAANYDDRIIFYFAGHGYIQPDLRGIDVGYLACADTDPENPYDGLEYEEVTKLSRYAKAKHIAFILDACFSGTALGLTRAAIPEAAVSEYLSHQAYQVLTAGAVEVVSDARSMTGELVKALRVGIPERRGPITFNHISQYIHDTIHAQSKGRQSPIFGLLEGSSKGQMVLLTPSQMDLLPEDLQKDLRDPNPRLRHYAIGAAEKLLTHPTFGQSVRAVLEVMQVDDEDRAVRRRAAEALRSAPTAVQPAPPTGVTPSDEESREIEPAPVDVDALIRTGDEFHRQGLLEKAEAAYRKVLKVEPQHLLAVFKLGWVLEGQDRVDESEEIFQQAMEINPNSSEGYLLKGLFLMDEDSSEAEAEEAFRKAVEVNPQASIAYTFLGMVLFEQERMDEAEAHLRKAIEIDPQSFEGHIFLGLLLGDTDREQEMEDILLIAVGLEPKLPIPEMQAIQGDLLVEMGREEEAEAAYRNALIIDPEDASTYISLAGLVNQQGDPNEALNLLETASKLDDFDPEQVRVDEKFKGLKRKARFKKIVGPKP